MTTITKKLPSWLSAWTATIAIIVGAALLSLFFGELIGDLFVLVGLAAITYYRYHRRRVLRDELAVRLMTRIQTALAETLAHQPYEVLSLKQWDMERLADWPDTQESPAPVAAFDITVKTERSEPEQLTLLLDPHLLVLPVLTDLPITPSRPCPACEYGDLRNDHDGVAHQVSTGTTIWFYTWRCDRCSYAARTDLLGNPEHVEIGETKGGQNEPAE